jgi:hypothetical protein
MSTVAAARVGLALGLACTAAVAVWLGARTLGVPGAAVVESGSAALRGLWLALALAIAVAGPRGVASRVPPAIAGLLVMLAVPLPLYLALRLAGVAPPGTLLGGIGLLAAGATGVPLLAAGVRRLVPGPGGQRIALAALETGLAAAAWVLAPVWLGWTGA